MKPSDVIKNLGQPTYYYPEMRKVTGSVTSTIFFLNLYFWTGSEASQDGWIYKSSEEIEKETGLTYEEQKTARARLKKIGLLEEHYRRLEHLMYYRVNTDMFNFVWAETYQDSNIREQGNATFGEQGNATFDPICSLLNKHVKRPKNGSSVLLDENTTKKHQVIDAYNEVAVRRRWYVQDGVPKSGESANLLGKRILEEDFMDNLMAYMVKLEALDWADSKKITFALRRQTYDNCMSGEWRPSNKNKQEPTTQDVDMSKPWNNPDYVPEQPKRVS